MGKCFWGTHVMRRTCLVEMRRKSYFRLIFGSKWPYKSPEMTSKHLKSVKIAPPGHVFAWKYARYVIFRCFQSDKLKIHSKKRFPYVVQFVILPECVKVLTFSICPSGNDMPTTKWDGPLKSRVRVLVPQKRFALPGEDIEEKQCDVQLDPAKINALCDAEVSSSMFMKVSILSQF